MQVCYLTVIQDVSFIVHSRDVFKTKIQFLKNRTIQKFDIHLDGFPIETVCNPPFK